MPRVNAPEKVTIHGFVEGPPESSFRMEFGELFHRATFRVRTLDSLLYECRHDDAERVIDRLGSGERVTVDGWLLDDGTVSAVSIHVPRSAKF